MHKNHNSYMYLQPTSLISDPILQFLLQALQDHKLSTVAATSLQSISTQCRDKMVDHFQGLLQIVQAMDGFNLSSDAALGLLKGIYTCSFKITASQDNLWLENREIRRRHMFVKRYN